jgi:hypothetical protein
MEYVTHQPKTFTGRVPFYERTPTAVAVDVLSGNRPERPIDPNLTDDLWNMTEKCWNRDPLWRPGISEVILRLRVATENGEPLDVTTLGSFPQREPSFEAPCYQPSLLTAASDKVRRLWRFGKAFVSQPSLGNDPADYTGSEGKSADMQPSASDLPRKSGGWFSGYTRRHSSGEKQGMSVTDASSVSDHRVDCRRSSDRRPQAELKFFPTFLSALFPIMHPEVFRAYAVSLREAWRGGREIVIIK